MKHGNFPVSRKFKGLFLLSIYVSSTSAPRTNHIDRRADRPGKPMPPRNRPARNEPQLSLPQHFGQFLVEEVFVPEAVVLEVEVAALIAVVAVHS